MKRIQRKRTKGWQMPKNTVFVGRPTKWGNPFILYGDQILINANHRRKILNPWVYVCQGTVEDVVRFYELLFSGKYTPRDMTLLEGIGADIIHWEQHFKTLDLNELKGKDLACWCPLSKPCHADILLNINNP